MTIETKLTGIGAAAILPSHPGGLLRTDVLGGEALESPRHPRVWRSPGIDRRHCRLEALLLAGRGPGPSSAKNNAWRKLAQFRNIVVQMYRKLNVDEGILA